MQSVPVQSVFYTVYVQQRHNKPSNIQNEENASFQSLGYLKLKLSINWRQFHGIKEELYRKVRTSRFPRVTTWLQIPNYSSQAARAITVISPRNLDRVQPYSKIISVQTDRSVDRELLSVLPLLSILLKAHRDQLKKST